MNYYPHNLGDYAKDTGGLNQGQHGAYRLLIDACYATENGVEADEVYTITKSASSDERKNTDKVLRKFFVLRDGRYYQKRIEEEIATFRVKSAKASKSAKKMWENRKNPDANASPEHGDNPGDNVGDNPEDSMRTHMPSHDLSHSERIPDRNALAMETNNQEPIQQQASPGINYIPAPGDNSRPKASTATPKAAARKSDAAIVAQGKRRGIEPHRGESMEAYEARLRTTRA